jgi:hypothetical protein
MDNPVAQVEYTILLHFFLERDALQVSILLICVQREIVPGGVPL